MYSDVAWPKATLAHRVSNRQVVFYIILIHTYEYGRTPILYALECMQLTAGRRIQTYRNGLEKAKKLYASINGELECTSRVESYTLAFDNNIAGNCRQIFADLARKNNRASGREDNNTKEG